MTPPRLIVPGATYLVTRRCIGRRFLLQPDKEMMNALLYCLAVAAKRYNVSVHAICVMSNHYHLICTDNEGNLPLFTQYFHRLVSVCVQKLRGWDEVVWEPGKRTSMVELLDEPAMIEKTLYTLCNPIKAGICRKEHQWPGNVFEGTFELERPDCFKTRVMPKSETLSFEPPPSMSDKDWRSTLLDQRADARANARQHAREHSKDGGRFTGTKAALTTKPTFYPRTKRFKSEISPRFACRCKKTLLGAIKQMYAFYNAYRTAVTERAQGITTDFPEGTWKMKRLLGQT